jgi:hypothetical protein
VDLKRLIFSLVFSLCAGTFLSFAAVRPGQVGRKYFLYHGLIVAAFALMTLVLVQRDLLAATLGFTAACTVFSFHQGVKPRIAWPAFGMGAGFALQGLWTLGSGASWLYPVSLYSSTALLGLTMAAMLLGHWYLNVPGLAIGELKRVTVLLFVFLLIRLVIAGIGIAPAIAGKSEMEIYKYLFSSTSGIFLLMRWFWGLLGPLGLSYFIWDTVKLRSTQSATGILYVAVVFVLIGETIAQYLTFFHGLPG